GARLRVEEGEDVAAVAIAVARSVGATYIVMGRPAQSGGLRRLGRGGAGRSLLGRLLRGLPGVDIRLVADPAMRGRPGEDGGEELAQAPEPEPAMQVPAHRRRMS
ncbi:MAG TPA: hypothetical protein VMG62_04775, partial [Solirubrobacteraceae bacterium]|nr:hypothetical protein [Solirubrobacteraceae bacterium]